MAPPGARRNADSGAGCSRAKTSSERKSAVNHQELACHKGRMGRKKEYGFGDVRRGSVALHGRLGCVLRGSLCAFVAQIDPARSNAIYGDLRGEGLGHHLREHM